MSNIDDGEYAFQSPSDEDFPMTAPVKHEPVAWATDDGDRVVTAQTKRDMPESIAASFIMALQPASTVETLTAQRDALLSRVERLEKALKPFANAAVVYDGHGADDPIWVALHDGSQIRITFGDLRNARAALQEKGHD